jgi:hypothetical protein
MMPLMTVLKLGLSQSAPQGLQEHEVQLNLDDISALNSASPPSVADDADFDEVHEEEVVVPETQESLQVIVLET